MERPKARRTAGAASAVVLALVLLVGCGPPGPAAPVIPAAFPPCLTSPICVVVNNGRWTTPLAIGDNGETLAALTLAGDPTTTPPVLNVLGIHKRWFEKVPFPGGDVSVTHDGRVLGIVSGSFVLYNQVTENYSIPNQPEGEIWEAQLSVDGNWAARAMSADQSNPEDATSLVILDLVNGTYTTHEVPSAIQYLHVSADASTVVWQDYPTDPGPLNLHVFSRATGTDQFIGSGAQPSVTGDGSRVGFVRMAGDDTPDGSGGQEQLVYWDQATATVIPFSPSTTDVFYQSQISSDGRHMVVEHANSQIFGLTWIEDWTVASGSAATIAGPVPPAEKVVMSTDGNHVIFNFVTDPTSPSGPYYLWNR